MHSHSCEISGSVADSSSVSLMGIATGADASTAKWINSSASSWPLSPPLSTSRERESAMFCLLGAYCTRNLYGWSRSTQRSIRAELRELVEQIVSRGLWSVSNVNFIPIRYIWNLSHPHTSPNASLSVCEYLHSTPVKARLAYAITLSCPSWTCVSTAPRPIGLVSVISLVTSAFLSKYANVSARPRLLFRVSNATSCSVPHLNGTYFLGNYLSGSVILAKLGMNRTLTFTNPRKLRTSSAFVGFVAWTTASTRDSVGPIPFLDSRYPMKVSCGILNTHFSGLRVSPLPQIHSMSSATCCHALQPYDHG